MKIVDYKIVRSYDDSRLTEAVKNFMEEGWTPIGGVAVIDNPLTKALYQTMVKYEKVSKNRSTKRSRSTSKK